MIITQGFLSTFAITQGYASGEATSFPTQRNQTIAGRAPGATSTIVSKARPASTSITGRPPGSVGA